MTGRLAIGLVLALLSSAAINAGLYVQHGAAAGTVALSVRHPVRSLLALFSNPRWLAGYLGGIGGWGLYILALALAPISLVQAASAGGIGVLALLAWRMGGVSLSGRERIGTGVALGGLLLLGLSLRGATTAGGASFAAVMVWVGCSGGAAMLAAGPLAGRLAPGAGLGAASGFLYAAGDVATKAVFGPSGTVALVPVLLACHLLGFVALQLGFQRGSAMATAGPSTLLVSVLPIVAGVALFSEVLPPGPWGVLRLLAFGGVVTGAVLLSRGEAALAAASVEVEAASAPQPTAAR